jgi:PAS domain S-box-containing protein
MADRDPSSPTAMPAILRYGIAVLSVAIAIGLGFFLLQHFEAKLTPFLFAVAATVWYAGTGPGVLAIVLSVLSLNYFFLRPVFSFSPVSYADLVYLIFCIFCALAVGWVSAVRRRAEQELRQVHDELEAKVAQRTTSLQRSERYLAEAQRLSHCGVTAYKGSTVFYGSEEIYRIWGFDPAQGVPSRKAVLQRIHPDDRDELNAVVERALAEKKPYSAAYRIVMPDGTVKHLESVGQPVFSTNGELVEVVATQIDVTERKRAEQALREREAKIRRLVDSNIIGIFFSGLKGRVLETNDAFLHLVGQDRDDLVSGRIRWTDLTPPEWRERDRRALAELNSDTIARPYEKEFFRKDGSRVPVLVGGALFEEGGDEGVAFVLDLTERKRAEQALREREAKIRRLVDSNIIGIFVWDFDGRILEANDEFLRMVSHDRDELVSGRIRWAELTPPDWRERNNARIEQQKGSGRFEPFEKEFTRKDGSRVPVLIGGATFEDGGSQGVAFVLDLTERKRAEEALRESERSARSALDGIAGLVAIMAPNGEVETVNRQCVEYFGRPVEEQKDWVATDMVHPEDLPDMLENFKRAIASEIPYQFEQRLRRFDGEYRWFETRGGAVRDDTGSIVRWYVLLTDIEDRKRAEDALRESEHKLRQIIDTIPAHVVRYQPDGAADFMNQTFSEFVGPGIGFDNLGSVVHPEDYPKRARDWDIHVAAAEPYDIEMRVRRADGVYRWHRSRRVPLRDANGAIVNWYGAGHDIDDQKRAEEAYREAQLELAHANRVATVGQLTASITHEVNQPITAAITYALAARRWLSAEPPNLHEVDDALSLIVKEGNRAGEVVGRIRALIKKAPARKDAVAINDAILEVVALTRTEAANNRVAVRTQLAEGLPPVQGDRVQLQQVLLNLILNAIEAMRDVEEKRELLISTRHQPDGVSVEVRDSGPGFAPATLQRVFEAFYTTKSGGLGLGLSICRSIIEAHGGRLRASANLPRGASFEFTVPAHPDIAS